MANKYSKIFVRIFCLIVWWGWKAAKHLQKWGTMCWLSERLSNKKCNAKSCTKTMLWKNIYTKYQFPLKWNKIRNLQAFFSTENLLILLAHTKLGQLFLFLGKIQRQNIILHCHLILFLYLSYVKLKDAFSEKWFLNCTSSPLLPRSDKFCNS